MRQNSPFLTTDKRRSDRFFFAGIILLSVTVLSFTLFFTRSNTIEENLVESIPLELSYSDQFYFSQSERDEFVFNLIRAASGKAQKNYARKNAIAFRRTFMEVNHLSSEPEVTRFSYILEVGIPPAVFLEDQSDEPIYRRTSIYTLTGSMDLETLSEKITLVETSANAASQFSRGNSIIIPSNWTIQSEEGERFVSLKDSVSICRPDNSSYATCTVIGTYDDWEQTGTVYAANSFLYHYIDQNPDLFCLSEINPPVIKQITYSVKDYDAYLSFQKKMVQTSDRVYREIGQPLSTLWTSEGSDTTQKKTNEDLRTLDIQETEYSNALASVGDTKNIYTFILTLTFVLIIIMLISFIQYTIRQRTREIFIFYSLGEKYNHTCWRYTLSFIRSAMIPMLIGLICGYAGTGLIIEKLNQSNQSIRLTLQAHAGISMENETFIAFQLPIKTILIINILVILCMGILLNMITKTEINRMRKYFKHHSRSISNY